MEMDAARWLRHYRRNQDNRLEPDWDAPITLPPEVVRTVVHSLEQFCLGDGGGPASLVAWDAESFRGRSEAARELVDLWFAEEKEHSRLLGDMVRRFGGTPITGHWSFSVFCAVRRWFGVRFELTVLLLTEICSTVYYRLLRQYGQDPALRDMCGLILRDEAGHIAFHRDRMARVGRGRAWRYGWWWSAGFQVLGMGAATMLWVNHRPALRVLGATDREYYREIWRGISRFIRQLRRESQAAALPVARERAAAQSVAGSITASRSAGSTR